MINTNRYRCCCVSFSYLEDERIPGLEGDDLKVLFQLIPEV